MNDEDYRKLEDDLLEELLRGAGRVGIIGLTRVALKLFQSLSNKGMIGHLKGIYSGQPQSAAFGSVPIRGFASMEQEEFDVLVVAADDEKEELILQALPHIVGAPKVIVSGYGHYRFRDEEYERGLNDLLVPSFANGYPNTLPHIYQCLWNAAKLKLDGVVAEFGMFKGGTTMFIARQIKRLGVGWKLYGFDSFDGFPPRRSPLDMYDHPGCVFTDLPAVRRYFADSNVEIVPGDIVRTAEVLRGQPIVLAFIDTDNYTPASAALDVVVDQVLVGGAIIFDHFAGVDKFRYTLGERIAASRLLDDGRYFNLHGTGVFLRQR